MKLYFVDTLGYTLNDGDTVPLKFNDKIIGNLQKDESGSLMAEVFDPQDTYTIYDMLTKPTPEIISLSVKIKDSDTEFKNEGE